MKTRRYEGEKDLIKIMDFLTKVRNVSDQCNYLHPGDAVWRLYHAPFDPHQNIQLWEDVRGTLGGFVWFYPPDGFDMQVHPDITGELEGEMLIWAEKRWEECTHDEKNALITGAREDDRERIAFLEEHGFVRREHHFSHFSMSLEGIDIDIPPFVPEGFCVREVKEEDIDERVNAHREAFYPSRFTAETYLQLRRAPGYSADLDVVALAPDGTVAAFCICWLDLVNKVGELEPVGTRPRFQKKGVGKAVVLEGLRRLKWYGARTALVLAEGGNRASNRLYESVGFNVLYRDRDYVKTFPTRTR